MSDNVYLIPMLRIRGTLPPFSRMFLRGTQLQLCPKLIKNTEP